MEAQEAINSVPKYVLSLGMAVIIIAVMALVLVTMAPSTRMQQFIDNETFASGTSNTTYLDQFGYEGTTIDTLYVYNNTQQNYAPVPATNYTYWSNNGTLELKDTPLRSNGQIKTVDYYYTGWTNATYITYKGAAAVVSFADWFTIMVVIVVAVIILLLVMMVGRQTGGT